MAYNIYFEKCVFYSKHYLLACSPTNYIRIGDKSSFNLQTIIFQACGRIASIFYECQTISVKRLMLTNQLEKITDLHEGIANTRYLFKNVGSTDVNVKFSRPPVLLRTCNRRT